MGGNVSRKEFTEKISPIIKIDGNLKNYIKENIRLENCKECSKNFFVKEQGLALENISIYHRFIHLFNIYEKHFCIGKKDGDYVLCYSQEAIPYISKIQREIFTKISTIAHVLSNMKSERISYEQQIIIKNKEAEKFWERLNQGVQALINAYQKTKFLESKDIFNIKCLQGDMIFLHGHQLRDFLKGRRMEQQGLKKYTEVPYLIQVGHYHKLGLFSMHNRSSIVCLSGCFLSPEIYFPELLSNVGKIDLVGNKDKFSLFVDRFPIYNKTKKNSINVSLEKRLEFLNTFKDALFMVPGNHDAFDEVFVKSTIAKLYYGMGDYVELYPDEYPFAKDYYKKFFEENNFISKCKINCQLDFNEIVSKSFKVK